MLSDNSNIWNISGKFQMYRRYIELQRYNDYSKASKRPIDSIGFKIEYRKRPFDHISIRILWNLDEVTFMSVDILITFRELIRERVFVAWGNCSLMFDI